jgi:hypothetical protein
LIGKVEDKILDTNTGATFLLTDENVRFTNIIPMAARRSSSPAITMGG